MSFRSFLSGKSSVSTNESSNAIDTADLANQVSKTLGRKLSANGWVPGSRGSGVIAMKDFGDDPEAIKQEAAKAIRAFLKASNSQDKLKKSRFSDDLSVAYEGAVIAIVEGRDVIKIVLN